MNRTFREGVSCQGFLLSVNYDRDTNFVVYREQRVLGLLLLWMDAEYLIRTCADNVRIHQRKKKKLKKH